MEENILETRNEIRYGEFGKEHILVTFKDVWPETKRHLIRNGVPDNLCEKIEFLTKIKLQKSDPKKSITQKWINQTIIKKLKEAAYNVHLMKFEKGKLASTLDLGIISKQLEKVFDELNSKIFPAQQ